jgi:triacylglycerol esterase/lipase EstA (alpha/beta hydrolase family)
VLGNRFSQTTTRMLGRLLASVVIVLAFGAAPALGAYAPTDQPGPPLDVSTAQLAAALTCTAGVSHATRAPVLLVPGSGSTPAAEFSWNYEPALTRAGIPWCAVTLPESANGDIQTAGEYMVYSIRTMYARAGRRISIIGHSQGGMVGRWALRWWPDTRQMVDDLIGIAPSNNGSVLPHVTCNNGCSPADSQQASGSNFLTALNSVQETFPGVSYSVIMSRFDEEAIPPGTLAGGGGQITNTYVQDVCPNDHTEHLGLGTYDPVAYALAIDALDRAGPANPANIPVSVCAQQFMPGVNPLTFPTDSANAAYADETSASPTVYREPSLACYTTATCTGARAPSLRLSTVGRRRSLRVARRARLPVLVRVAEGAVLVPVPGVTVTFAGRRVLTDASGHATLPIGVARAGRYRLVASRTGCNSAVKRLTVARRAGRRRRGARPA